MQKGEHEREIRFESIFSDCLVDKTQVFANGYSGGGETMFIVLEKQPDLFTAYLHCSSRWEGDIGAVADARVPVYMVVGENDEYYGSEPTKEAYRELAELYFEQGLSETEINKFLILDIKHSDYFAERGADNEHAGGLLFAFDENIMSWLFEQ